jgi:hypothetical protein
MGGYSIVIISRVLKNSFRNVRHKVGIIDMQRFFRRGRICTQSRLLRTILTSPNAYSNLRSDNIDSFMATIMYQGTLTST